MKDRVKYIYDFIFFKESITGYTKNLQALYLQTENRVCVRDIKGNVRGSLMRHEKPRECDLAGVVKSMVI